MSKAPSLPYGTTHEIRDRCLCLNMQRAARALARHFDEAFRSLGLTNGQFSLLTSLNRPEPPTIGSVAALLAMDRTTLTAALKPLVRRGLIDVKEDARDRRNRRVSLTAAGRVLVREAAQVWRATHDELDGLLAGAVGKGLPNSLHEVSRALQRQ